MLLTFQRSKCIGCNYCHEHAPSRWVMSGKDGKAVLIGAKDRKGFHSVTVHESERRENEAAAAACPVKIITYR